VRSKVELGEIPNVAGERLMWKLWNKEEGIEGKETSIGRGYPSDLNPYKVNGKYLSVFQVTLKNTTSTVKKIRMSELLFNSGYEQLYPFETSYFDKLYQNDQEKLRIIYRLNMPEEMLVPPGKTVIKYVSVPSINPATKDLDVKIIQDATAKNFSFIVNIEEQSQSTTLENITFKALDESKLQVMRYYFVLVTPDNRVHIIKNNTIFLPQDVRKDKISIYGIATLPTGYAYVKKENFTLGLDQFSEVFLNFSEKNEYIR
jgi:hypothetical protein